MTLEDDRVQLPRHQDTCAVENLETFPVASPRGEFRVTRCVGCGAQNTEAPAEEPLEWGSAEWADAWLNDKERITRHLTRAEYADANKNPLHPVAESWPHQVVPKSQRKG